MVPVASSRAGGKFRRLDGAARELHYLKRPFTREPDFAATSVNYDLWDLRDRAEPPA
jgi:hypothetical protein